MPSLPYLYPEPVAFPDPHHALDEPDGLLAAGGELTVPWLLEAYGHGIFPWFDDDREHILWWSPSHRAVIEPGAMRVTRSLAKRIRNGGFSVAIDTDFAATIQACGTSRRGSDGTWITPRMDRAYNELHEAGYAHSVEVYRDAKLVGGLYGVSLGTLFFGESMFSHCADASKVAFYWLHRLLTAWRFDLIDCQILNPHLVSLGVGSLPRAEFLKLLHANRRRPTRRGRWSLHALTDAVTDDPAELQTIAEQRPRTRCHAG